MTRQPWTACVAAFAVSLLATHCYAAQPVDDAFIVFRYAFNLVNHGELVWNLGERVEGSTSLLWPVVIATISYCLGPATALTTIPHVALELAALLHAGTSVALWQALTRLGLSAWQGLAWVCGFQLAPAIVGLALNGLETQLFAFGLALIVLALTLRRPVLTGVLGVLLFAVRPEGLVVALGMCVAVSHARWPRHALQWLVVMAGLGAIELFRVSYYGSWLPNSVIAKSVPLSLLPDVVSRLSLPYVVKFLRDPFCFGLLLLVAASGYVGMRRRDSKVLRWAALLPIATLLLSLVVVLRNGGDWMPHHRLFLQYGPFLVIGAAALTPALPSPTRPALLIAAIFPLASLVTDSGAWRGPAWVRVDPQVTRIFLKVGERLKGLARPDDVVSVEMAGFLPYVFSSLRAHDPCGLTDWEIGHRGTPAPPYGRDLPEHTMFRVRPTFAVFHAVSHVFRLDPKRLDHEYVGLCDRGCGCRDPRGDVLFIRRDRATPDVLGQFSDFTPWSASCTP